MTSAAAIQEEISRRTFVMCGVLSLALHACLLAGLGLIQTAKPVAETVPVVKVTLRPTEIPTKTESPSPTPETKAPPLQTVPRRIPSPPIVQPTRPQISQPQPIKATAALQLDPMPTTIEPSTPVRKTRTLKDTLASNALFAQSATKMVKRSRTNVTVPSAANTTHMTIDKLPTVGSSSLRPIQSTPLAAMPPRSRRLTASLPATEGLGLKKIAIRHSVRPVYPRVAKEEGWEGIVLLRVLVHRSGMPGTVTIQKSSGYKILDDAAIEAIRQWRFAPAKDGNFAIEKHVDVPLKFGLHG
ncbi:TonB family protein [Candidatus Nitrospira salsa]